MDNKEIMTCENCDFYNGSSPHLQTGKGICMLHESVGGEKGKSYMGRVNEQDTCLYGLIVSEEVELTREGIFKILNQKKNNYWEKIELSDIDLESLTQSLEVRSLSLPK